MSWLQNFLLLSIWGIKKNKKIKEKDPDRNICQNILNSLYMPSEIKSGALKEQTWKRREEAEEPEARRQKRRWRNVWTDGGGYAWLKGARRTEAGWNVPCVCVCVCSWMKHHIPSPLLLKHPFFSPSGPFPTLILTQIHFLAQLFPSRLKII